MILEPRTVKLTTRTGVDVRRTLPHGLKRTIGAWCFVDHFGPTEQVDGMVVAKHPHTGLQTVTWLFEGAVEHRDSAGSIQLISPGQVNVMTSGLGIAHSELSQATTDYLHAVQLWVALPEAELHRAPSFEHVRDLPVLQFDGGSAQVFIGELGVGAGQAVSAPTQVFSPLLGAELRLDPGASVIFAANTAFEYGLLAVQGSAAFNSEAVAEHRLGIASLGVESLTIRAGDEPFVGVLLGGEPLGEPLVMWWNFVGRSHDDIVKAREEWNARTERFGDFEDHIGGWLPAPDLPNYTFKPRF